MSFRGKDLDGFTRYEVLIERIFYDHWGRASVEYSLALELDDRPTLYRASPELFLLLYTPKEEPACLPQTSFSKTVLRGLRRFFSALGIPSGIERK